MGVPAIGIDLGTTNTCVAVYKNGAVVVIPNERGSKTFPSMVCFTDDGTKIGHVAKDIAHEYPDQTVCDVKRIIGSKFDDASTRNQTKKWQFQVINSRGNPSIRVKQNDSYKNYYPEEISAMVLKHAKKLAEDYLQCPITRAVITVPAYFNNSQRQATKDAAKIAGLKVLRMINEPTAAAITYGWENKSFVERTILVYDLGGGTFDVSIVKIEKNDYIVLATSGDTHLGGGDFDVNMEEYFAKKFEAKHNLDMRKDRQAMRRLRSKCEKVKEGLSFHLKRTLELFSIFNGKDLDIQMSRLEFEHINHDLFQRTVDIVDNCIMDACLKKTDITDIVLVGGSTRIPRIQEMLSLYFDNRDLKKSVNPDEAVALGAAIQASILNGDKAEHPMEVTIRDVTSLSLGKSIYSGKMVVLINRNSRIPCQVTKSFLTIEDNQTTVTKCIYQGERTLAEENMLLGTLRITNLPKRPKGEVEFLDTFSLDEDGILQVDSVVEGTALEGRVVIKLEENRLDPAEVERLIREAECRAADDMQQVMINQAKYDLESYCQTTKSRATQSVKNIGKDNSTKIVRTCEDAMLKIRDIADPVEMKDLLREIKLICRSLLKANES